MILRFADSADAGSVDPSAEARSEPPAAPLGKVIATVPPSLDTTASDGRANFTCAGLLPPKKVSARPKRRMTKISPDSWAESNRLSRDGRATGPKGVEEVTR